MSDRAVTQEYRVGAYTPSEDCFLLRSKYATASGTARLVVYCHGYNLTVAQMQGSPNFAFWAHAGFPMLVIAAGGTNTFGNDASVSAITGAVNWALGGGVTGIKTDKVILAGASMGSLDTANYLKANPGKVAAWHLSLPAINLQDIHDNRFLDSPTNSQLAGPVIESAYGGSATYTSQVSSKDPYQNQSVFAALNIPALFTYSNTDPLALPQYVTGFAAVVGATAVDMGALGHSDTSYYDGAHHYETVLNFFDAHQ